MGVMKRIVGARLAGVTVPKAVLDFASPRRVARLPPTPEPRPSEPGALWYLYPGAMPVAANDKHKPTSDPTHFCREHETRWRPISEL